MVLRSDKGSLDQVAQRYLAVCDERDELRAALRQILEDPDAQILDSHRDDGWTALGKNVPNTSVWP